MGQGEPSGLGPSHIHSIHPGPLYFPAGPLTPHHSGCTRNSKYLLSDHHFRTGLPGLLTLGILPGMQNWALCYIYLLLLLPSLLSHPSFFLAASAVSHSQIPPKEMMSWVKQSSLMRSITGRVLHQATPVVPSHPLATEHTVASFLGRDLWCGRW